MSDRTVRPYTEEQNRELQWCDSQLGVTEGEIRQPVSEGMQMRPRHRLRNVGLMLAMAAGVLGQVTPAGAYLRPGDTQLVSVTRDGSMPDSDSRFSSVDAKGRFVAFHSRATDLVPGDSNGTWDIFLRDIRRGATRRLSVSPEGTGSLGACIAPAPSPIRTGSFFPSITPDGRFVSFTSCASNLVPGDTNLTWDVFVVDVKTGVISRVSVASDGSQAGGPTPSPTPPASATREHALSADGRYVAFNSMAGDLVEDDTNEQIDTFVHDRRTGRTERVSVSSSGQQSSGQGGSFAFSIAPEGAPDVAVGISSSGRHVIFSSGATDLVEQEVNGTNAYVHDRKTGRTELVSVASDGSPQRNVATALVARPQGIAISGNGRFAAFLSNAGSLVPNHSRARPDAYVHDRKTGRTEKVSVSSSGEEAWDSGPEWEWDISLSENGRYVMFGQNVPNFAPDDQRCRGPGQGRGPGGTDPSQCGGNMPYAYDRKTGAIELFGRSSQGSIDEVCMDGGCFPSSISPDGRYVTWFGFTDGGIRGPRSFAWLRDRGLPLTVGELVASGQAPGLSLAGDPAFSRTGTAWIEDAASGAVVSKLGKAGELLGARITYRPQLEDVFVALELERLPRTPALAAATAGAVYGMSFDLDGKAYEIRAVSTGLGLGGETTAAFGLFSCPEKELNCTKVAELEGGFGTTGERITFALPLDDLDVQGDSVISEAEAFVALGTFLSGPNAKLDKVTP